jgi:hypothetical protein
MKAKLFCLALLLLSAPALGGDCAFEFPPTVLEDSASPRRHLVVWEEVTGQVLRNTKLPATRTFQNYRSSVEQALPTAPDFLLERYLSRADRREDIHNIRMVLKGAGELRQIRCAEALLLDYQIQRNSLMLSRPTEFFAVYLSRQGKLRIYLLTNDAEGVSGMGALHREISRAVSEGWKVIVNLHNHSFFFADLDGDKPQGVLAPSGSDMRVLKGLVEEFGPVQARITNGFHSIFIESMLFPLFEAAE